MHAYVFKYVTYICGCNQVGICESGGHPLRDMRRRAQVSILYSIYTYIYAYLAWHMHAISYTFAGSWRGRFLSSRASSTTTSRTGRYMWLLINSRRDAYMCIYIYIRKYTCVYTCIYSVHLYVDIRENVELFLLRCYETLGQICAYTMVISKYMYTYIWFIYIYGIYMMSIGFNASRQPEQRFGQLHLGEKRARGLDQTDPRE
jgi:hypothetical protein